MRTGASGWGSADLVPQKSSTCASMVAQVRLDMVIPAGAEEWQVTRGE